MSLGFKRLICYNRVTFLSSLALCLPHLPQPTSTLVLPLITYPPAHRHSAA